MKKLIAFVVAAVLLGGCATLPELEGLSASQKPQAFRLKQLVEWNIRHAGKPAKFGLLPGTYTAVEENSVGTFFRGEPYSVFYPSAFGRYFVRTGGFWVPKDPSREVKTFVYFNYESKEVADYSAIVASHPNTFRGASGINVLVTPVSGPGIVGGIVASGIINAAIDADTGKIQLQLDIPDRQISANIKRLASGN